MKSADGDFEVDCSSVGFTDVGFFFEDGVLMIVSLRLKEWAIEEGRRTIGS